MEGSASAPTKVSTERAARPKTRAARSQRPSASSGTAAELHAVFQSLGNLEIQRLLKAVKPRESSTTATKSGAPAEKLAGVSEQSPRATARVAADGGVRPVVTARTGVAAAVSGDTADLPAEAAPRTAWGDPQSDPAYQTVAKKLGTNASRQKTPVKDAEEKKGEVRNAADLSPVRQQEKRGYDQQMTDLAATPLPKIADFTVDAFMEAFERGFQELAKQLPKASENNRAVSSAVNFSAEKAVAVGEMKSQRDTKSQALSETASRNPMDSPAAKATPPATPELTRDPAGPRPAIPQAAAAAPKPVPSENISLDDQSKALDDAMSNQVAGGQVLNITEASLALPVSGEKSFDEAGEAKRKAQEFIRKMIPGYRGVEAGVLKKAGHKAEDLVGTGLQDFHGARNESFGGVLADQRRHEKTVEVQKDAVLSQFEGIYNDKKKLVDKELAALNGVGDDFEQALTKAEGELKKWVRNNLEYIYTPGMFDYSDWIDKNKPRVTAEYERLKRLNRDELDVMVYARALKTIQDKDAVVLFDEAKGIFLRNVTAGARTIAVTIVDTLNRAKNHIVDGQHETQKIYNSLSATEKTEYENAYLAVQGQYTTLAESVADRHREIVADMARSYHKVAGTLQATFEAIRKDVLTSWWQKAWNKIKAVVGAIVEFATRIAQLLGKMLHLLGDIISSPRYFFNNLVTGIGRGLSTFAERIDDFLAEAFFDWLRGSTGVTVHLPKDWDPKGIFGLFTELLGLSTETIWQRMEVVYDKTIANVFRRGEAVVEKGLELFEIVRKDGLGGLWSYIKESLGTILTDTLESMKETILYAAIKKVMIEVGKLLIPGGGFIAIAEKIIRLLVFIVEARDKILNLIQSFVESMENAVNGDVSGIVSKITGALKTFITVALDFLVAFFGLGGLKSKVERVIERMRNPIIRGIDWVLGKLKPIVMKMKGAAGRIKEKAVALLDWWRERREFRGADGKQHSVFVQGSEQTRRLVVASDEREVTGVLHDIIQSNTAPAAIKTAAGQALRFYNQNLAPVIHGRADPALEAQFPANLTAFTAQLRLLVGLASALPPAAPPVPGAPPPIAQGPARPPFVLRLPRQKAPHLNVYQGWLGTLQSDPNYARGNPGQLEIWHQALRLGGSHGIPASVYERGHQLGFSGGDGERRIRVPNWSRRGNTPMEVDHIIELQVTPPSMRNEFNSASNFELLDRAANGSAGPLMAQNIAQDRAQQVAADPAAANQVLRFDQVVIDGGSVGQRWSIDEIRAGEHLDFIPEQ